MPKILYINTYYMHVRTMSSSNKKFIPKILVIFIVIVFLTTAVIPAINYSNTSSNLKMKDNLDQNQVFTQNAATPNSGYVKYTLIICNNTLLNGNVVNKPNSIEICSAAFDSTNGYIYVTDFDSNSVTVINGATNSVVSTIPVGSGVSADAFDPSNGYIYASNFGSNSISVINGATNTVVSTISMGTCPSGVVFDPSNGYIYAMEWSADSVAVINGATNTVVSTIPVGTNPYEAAVDLSNGYLYVTNDGSNSISVINGATNSVISTIPVGTEPFADTFDPSNGYIYASNYGSNSISVINGATNSVVSTIPVGNGPFADTFDPSNGYIYVTIVQSDSVTVINGATNSVVSTIPVGTDPQGAVFDSSNGYIYITNLKSGSVSIISTSSPVTLYSITFTESGLLSGTSWSVTMNSVTESSKTSTITFKDPDGTYLYSIGNVSGNRSSPSNGKMVVNGFNIEKTIKFYPDSVNNYLIYDNFVQDHYINTSKWSIDSPVLENITNVDHNLFGWPISPIPPEDFAYYFYNGLDLDPCGYDNMAGFTSNTVFTYPASINANFTINASDGGDSMIILSNATGSNMIGIFIGSQLYVQDGNEMPSYTGYSILPDVEYHVSLYVKNSQFTVYISSSHGTYSNNFIYSPSGNQSLYLTFGSYIGTFSGEQITHTETPPIVFQNISAASEARWNLSIYASTSDGQPDSGVNVTVVNAFTNNTVSATTPSNGTVKFANLKSGGYYVIASQTQNGVRVTDSRYVFVGESYNPSLFDIALSIKIIPPLPPKLSATISSVNSTQAEAPWENTFVATASGYVQNYSYKWYVNNKYAGSGYELNDTFYNPSGAGSTSYTISLNVSSQGSWFGTVYSRQTANISIEQIVYSKPLFLNLTQVSENPYAEISFGTHNNMAVGYIKGTTLYLKFNITDLFLKNTIPGWLMDIIGISYPYWGVNISDKAGNDNNIMDVLQPGTSACLRDVALPGSINSIKQLSKFAFDVTLTPGALYAIIGDIVQIVLSAAGVISALSLVGSLAPAIMEALVGDLVMELAHATAVNSLPIFTGSSVNIESAILSSFTSFLENIIPAIPSILNSLAGELLKNAPNELKSLTDLSATLTDNIDNIFPAWKIVDLAVDIGAVLGAALEGDLTTQYEIKSYENSINYCVVDPGGALPDVEILNKNGDMGWNGTWVGSRYSHSSFTNSGYAFSVPANGTSTLEIYNPSETSTMQYNMNISVGNHIDNLRGTLAPNSNVKYSVSSNSTSLSLSKEYRVSFIAKNIPPDTKWSVTLNGITEYSNTSEITFSEPNGTYSYKVNNVSGYILSPSSGSITVNGSNMTQVIVYSSNPTEKSPLTLFGIGIYTIGLIAIFVIAIGAIIITTRKKK